MTANGPFEVRPIGVVHCAWRTRDEVPVAGGPAVIEVRPEYAPALDCLDRASHVLVLAFLHEAERGVLSARPRKLDPSAPPCGVFASRSPARPNPISVSAVPLLRVEGLRLHVDHLDLMDGTPVVDIKTYSPGHDCVFAARSVRRVRPSALPDGVLAAFLERELENHVGPVAAACPEARMALAAVMVAVRRLGVDARGLDVSVHVNRGGVVVDTLMGLLGATLSSGRVHVEPGDGPTTFRFTRAGRAAMTLVETPRTPLILAEPLRWVEEAFATVAEDAPRE